MDVYGTKPQSPNVDVDNINLLSLPTTVRKVGDVNENPERVKKKQINKQKIIPNRSFSYINTYIYRIEVWFIDI